MQVFLLESMDSHLNIGMLLRGERWSWERGSRSSRIHNYNSSSSHAIPFVELCATHRQNLDSTRATG